MFHKAPKAAVPGFMPIPHFNHRPQAYVHRDGSGELVVAELPEDQIPRNIMILVKDAGNSVRYLSRDQRDLLRESGNNGNVRLVIRWPECTFLLSPCTITVEIGVHRKQWTTQVLPEDMTGMPDQFNFGRPGEDTPFLT